MIRHEEEEPLWLNWYIRKEMISRLLHLIESNLGICVLYGWLRLHYDTLKQL